MLRQTHRAGEKTFVDYAGATIPIHDPATGEIHPAAVFVAVLGASSYTFAEATAGQDLRSWIGSHVRAFRFFDGVTELWRAHHKRAYVKDRIMRRKDTRRSRIGPVAHNTSS